MGFRHNAKQMLKYPLLLIVFPQNNANIWHAHLGERLSNSIL